MIRRGLGLVISSPSGAGKSSLVRKLHERDHRLEISISVTTRPIKTGEQDGQDYHFITRSVYDDMVKNNDLLEHAEVFGHGYGTPQAKVEQHLREGRDVVFDIDWQGYRQLKQSMGRDLVSVFLLPPSLQELHDRLQNRGRDTEEVIKQRMEKAVREISHAHEYDWVFENVDIDWIVSITEKVIESERQRYFRNFSEQENVKTLMEKA